MDELEARVRSLEAERPPQAGLLTNNLVPTVGEIPDLRKCRKNLRNPHPAIGAVHNEFTRYPQVVHRAIHRPIGVRRTIRPRWIKRE